MILLLLSVLAAASAAPHYYHHRHHPFHHHPPPPYSNYGLMDPFIEDDVLDLGSFWEDLSKELQKLDEVLQEFEKHFPGGEFSAGEEDGSYKITIILDGYKESEIIVKAKDGVLMIQATHTSENGGVQRNYLDLRTLPDNVSAEGNWSYDGRVLRIVFPLKSAVQTTTETAVSTTETEIATTASSQVHSREQMESNEDTGKNNLDADVGLHTRGDNELLTNEIPRRNSVEATTYAVDFKNEVEFVPIRF